MNNPVISKRLPSELQLPVSKLRVGMFIAEPDCGWRSTPFPLEGLLLKNTTDIATLSSMAQHVTVDPARSVGEAFLDEELAAMMQTVDLEGLPPASIARALALEPEGRFKHFVADAFRDDLACKRPSFLTRVRSWWRESRNDFARHAGLPVSRPLKPSERPAYVPAGIDLVAYRDPEPTPSSLPKVKATFRHVEKTLERVAAETNANGIADGDSIRDAADTLVDNMILRPSTMMWVAKLRANSNSGYEKAVKVAVHLTALGRQIGFQKEQLADLASIGLLLDLGKIGMPPELLDKPGSLDEDEADLMRGHVDAGLKMFSESCNIDPAVIQAIAEHHERIDGSGYPAGRIGSEISIYGKMAAIVDAFVAMTSPRSYAPTLTAYDAIRELFNDVDTGLHGPLVEQFVQAVGIFPVGSLVELSTGEVAIVVQHNQSRRLEPTVLILTDDGKDMLDEPREFDLLKHNARSEEAAYIVRGVTEETYNVDFRNYYLSKPGTGT